MESSNFKAKTLKRSKTFKMRQLVKRKYDIEHQNYFMRTIPCMVVAEHFLFYCRLRYDFNVLKRSFGNEYDLDRH